MRGLLSINVMVGLGLMAATGLYMAGFGPTTFVEQQKPVVGKFVSVQPKPVDGYTRPKGFMELVFDVALGRSHPDGTTQPDAGALTALHARQTSRAAHPPASFRDIVGTAGNAIRMANEFGVATGPTAFDPYIAEQARTAASYDPITRLNRR